MFFFFQAEDGIRYLTVTGVQTCALPIYAFAQATFQVNTDDVRCQEVNRLAQHRGFSFNSAHAPTDDAQAIHHRGVRIGRSEERRVGKEGSSWWGLEH